MLSTSLRRILELPADARVLDVGGWGSPFARADAVIDVMPYDTRGLYGVEAAGAAARFTQETWVQHDVCGADPWPFDDAAFDFAVCSHLLEDVRDPLRVCAELSRVARRGYVEVPAPIEELTYGVHGDWVGWSHHRWITEREVTADGPGLVFTHKPHLLPGHGRHLAAGTCDALAAEQRVLALWWDGVLPAREQIFIGADSFDPWLSGLLDEARATARSAAPGPSPARRGRRRRNH